VIVNYTQQGWEIITQRAHGILAAQLAAHWNKKDRPQRWTETLLAIAEHDDAECELDGENLLTPQGGPLNFDMKVFELAHCQKLLDLLLTKSRYITLLTSMHMDFLYRKDLHKVAGAAHFLQQQQKFRLRLRGELGLTRQVAEKIYCFMEWFDACSLLLCRHQIPPEKRTTEISHGADGTKYLMFQSANQTLSITPWPFSASAFTVQFESRLLSTIQFPDSAAFRKAFLVAPVKETVWNMKKVVPVIQPKTKKI
jgi:Protein of unknown function (DUF3891)